MGRYRYLKYVLRVFIALLATLPTLGRAQIVTSIVIYRPYAFIRIVPPQGETGPVFDNITARIRSKNKIDKEDFQTLAYLRDQATESTRDAAHAALKRPPLQYVDGGGAKFRIVDVWDTRFAAPAEVPNVAIDLGYASDTVDTAVVEAKVAELSRDAKDACDALGLRCSITNQFVKKPAVLDSTK